MPANAMILASDSHDPAAFPTPPFHPIFAVHDSLTGRWYELDADMWADVALQGDDDQDESAADDDLVEV